MKQTFWNVIPGIWWHSIKDPFAKYGYNLRITLHFFLFIYSYGTERTVQVKTI